MSKGWDNATLKKLKALTGKGLSTSEIGKRLGMSKNAIVGKLNRLGWNAKAGGAASAEVTEKKTATAKKTATTVKKVAEKKSAVKKGPAKTTKEAVKVVVKETAKKTESNI
jgi:GcrA cell cycle regulator